jgi:hypothetical protein
MRRNTWVLIAVLVVFLSILLIPTSYAGRYKGSGESAKLTADKTLPGGGPEIARRLNRPAPLQSRTQRPLTPVSARAVRFAVSEPVRELRPTSGFESDTEPKGEGEGREKNELNVKRTKTLRPDAALRPSIDRALQGARRIESEAPGAPSLTFDGLLDSDNDLLIGGRVAPSDENIDVGPNDVVQTVNDGFRIWDKNGVPKTNPTLISSLFGKLGGICATSDRGDPVVLYDRMADRWFITQFAFVGNGTTPPYHQCVAVSQNGDPQSAYFTYDFQTPGVEFPDYGKFGVWPDAYYMTVNQFTNGGPFNGAGVYALDRQKMLAGDPTAAFIYFNLNLTSNPEGVGNMQPSDQDGLQAPPAGAPNVFAYLISDEFENPPFDTDALRLFDFHADFATPANSTFTERTESPLAVAAFDPTFPFTTRAEIEQPPPSVAADRLDAIGYHLMYRLQYRNRGGIETLVASTTVNVSGAGGTTAATFQGGIRYFELLRSTPGGSFLLYDNATFSPDAGDGANGTNRWLPSAAIDHQGNLAVSYSVSSTTLFPSIWYAGRDFNALGGLIGEQSLFNGTAVQLASFNRWGDYQSLQVDPSDDCTFWTTNQYYNVNSAFNWRTRIGKFKFPTCQAPAQGTLSGTITACDSGAPISGAIVQLSNGFSSTTNASGTYSFNVAPGIYSVTVTDSVRSCDSSPTSLISITDGNTTTFDTCLTGIASPILDTFVANAIVISGGNGDTNIDANECNSLALKLSNPGCAPATDVSAHLSTSTPGVTITQSNSPYPDIAIDATATNSVLFSVSTDPSFVCGTTINFTLTITFTGGTKIQTFSLPTCVVPPVTGSITTGDPTQTGRLQRNGITSSCAVPKAAPPLNDAIVRHFDSYSFTNNSGAAACATFNVTSGCGANLFYATYLGSYNPASLTQNYLGDPGFSFAGTATWSVTVPAGQTVVLVIHEVTANSGCASYSATVSGLFTNNNGGGVCQACAITPPANITVNNDPNQCGAVVSYPAPTSSGTCGVITTSPASGSFFPVGTTTVTATATSGATATFTVTVNDTQPPIITCPANVSVTAPPNVSSVPVTLPAATVSDNCPGATVSFNPASGSNFNLGTTLVTATATDASGNTASCTFNVTVTQPDAVLFSAATYSINEGAGSLIATVNRTGNTATAATVDYASSNDASAACMTVNGFASEKCDYLAVAGTLSFAAGQTSKTIQIFINNDAYVEGPETFTLTLSNPVGTTASVQNVATVTIVDNDSSPSATNPIDDSTFFVIEQYRNFLNRDPDASGLAFWVGKISACGSNATCINQQRVAVSLAFFTSREFQETGFFVYRLYKGGLGNKPTYAQFLFDRSQLTEGPTLEADKQALTLKFVQRAAFTTKYPTSLSGAAFIDALLATVQSSSGLNLTAKKPELSAEYLAGAMQADSRARVLRKLVDYPEYIAAEFNSAFVQMQYFGYLNRDIDQGGFDFWLGILNSGAAPDSMVCAFITSAEYQNKYSPVITRTNASCGP